MIEKYLSEEIDFLLTPSANQLLSTEIDDVFINNNQIDEIEASLHHYMEKSSSDKSMFFTGLTGSGKTMLLRHVFKLNGMGSYILDKCLIIPFSFNNIHCTDRSKIEIYFRNVILAACDHLEDSFPIKKLMIIQKAFIIVLRRTVETICRCVMFGQDHQ